MKKLFTIFSKKSPAVDQDIEEFFKRRDRWYYRLRRWFLELSLWDQIKYFIRNTWMLRKVLANHRPWNYNAVFQFNHVLYKDLANSLKQDNWHVGSKERARQATVIAQLYNDLGWEEGPDKSDPRIRALFDKVDIFSLLDKRTGSETQLVLFLLRRERDAKIYKMELLTKYIRKYSQSFWS